MLPFQFLLVLAILVILVMLLLRTQINSTTVFEYERALRFVRGSLRDELGPGRYRYLRGSTYLRKVDTRPTLLAVNSQEVLSRDGVAVKASLSASYRITNARTAVLGAGDYATVLHAELQQALRIAIAGADIEALLASRAELGTQILRDVQPGAERIGIEVDQVAIRDLTLPGELKKIFAQVVKARQEGLASLERARGETAALRNLANAAQLVERNPQLLQLRLLQVAGQQTALTMVVGMPQGATPVPVADSGRTRNDLPPAGTTSDAAE